MIITICGATKTLRRLAVEYADVLGVLLTPKNTHASASVLDLQLPVFCDNAAFSDFNPNDYYGMLNTRKNTNPLWVTLPDVVGDHEKTLHRYNSWERFVDYFGIPKAFVIQDGCDKITDIPSSADCIFIGGSDGKKYSFGNR